MLDKNRKKRLQIIAETAWGKMKGCSLAEGKDLGKPPEIRFKKLKGFYGLAYPIVLSACNTAMSEKVTGGEIEGWHISY